MNPTFFNIQSYWVCIPWLNLCWICLLCIDIKGFMDIIRKYNNDMVICPSSTETLRLGFSVGEQKNRPGEFTLLSEAVDVVHR